jgi:multidrug resistance efflux pump
MALALGATWWVWANVLIAPTMMGEVEIVRAQVTSPSVGVVQQVVAQRFDEVKAGDPLVIIKPSDTRNLLNGISLELVSPGFSFQFRFPDNLAQSRGRLLFPADKPARQESGARPEQSGIGAGEKDLVRNAELSKENYVSKEFYDISLAERDSAQKEIEELSAVIPGLEEGVEKLRVEIEQAGAFVGSDFSQKIADLEARLASVPSDSTPIVLRAPIDRMVSGGWCSAGETVTEGYVMMMVNATEAMRIVAYMRQPFPVDPVPGMQAKIVTHSKVQRVLAVTEVETVGRFLEPITNSLARLGTDQMVDMGLPVSFKIPKEVNLRPGETVGLMLDGRRK